MKLTFSLLFILFQVTLSFSQNIDMYLGTFTDGKSEGIYKLQFDTIQGTLSDSKLITKAESPSFLAFSPNRNYLYATCREGDGIVSAFRIKNDNYLQLINSVDSHGASPCHVAVNSEGTKLVVSNYGGGTIALYDINSDGSLTEALQVFKQSTDEAVSHAHSAQFIDNHLFVADLGRNSVFKYQKNDIGDGYKLKTESIVSMQPNAGPRHFTVTKDHKFFYIINELNSSITVAKHTNKGFKLVEHISTLDDDFKGESYCADIHLSPDEQFLYGSNRGENSIVVFKRHHTTGKLKKIQNISVEGDWPRNFTIDPTGNFLLVGNRRTNNISIFNINKKNGKLKFSNSFNAPSPVCLLF
ncbi:lactonase family protein [Aestuariibaculum suncheonense]|uniref:Lactonase family protein n=1 Tax=Aestuariibaculum suncheonense TaxID=1028745 RepID=A0A8J6QDX3_9FLAO|nr:lactonase family protein [Aestuariibaculum suncheonense]MBD0834126.1 lactonase family protein [Aestuariibaculum suncheonense]